MYFSSKFISYYYYAFLISQKVISQQENMNIYVLFI